MMDEILKDFKIEMENFMMEMYQELDGMVDGALFNMSFYNLDDEVNFEKLQEVIIEVLQEHFGNLMDEEA